MNAVFLIPLLLFVQDPPPPPPVPQLAVIVTESVPLGRWLAIHVDAGEAKGVVVRVRQVLPGEDAAIPEGLVPRGGGEWAFTWDEGSYLIEAQAIVGDVIVSATAKATIGKPGPGPVPPDPTPPPVVKPGAKLVMLIYETENQTPELARLIGSLRSGPTEASLKAKGHRLLILDDEIKETGTDATPAQLVPYLAAVKSLLADQKKVALLIVDPLQFDAGGGILYVGEMPMTAEAFQALLAKHGG